MDIGAIRNDLAAISTPAEVPAPAGDAKDRLALIQAVHAVNEARLYGEQSELSFAVDRATRRSIVRIVDRETREVIQQIPSEQVLRLAEELKGG